MRIAVHIERLVLDGVDVAPADRARLVAGVERELARLMTAAPASLAATRGGATDAVQGGTLTHGPRDGVGRLAHGIARAAHRGLER